MSSLPPLPPPGYQSPRRPAFSRDRAMLANLGRLAAVGGMGALSAPHALGGLAMATGRYLGGGSFDPMSEARRLPGGQTMMSAYERALSEAQMGGIPEWAILAAEMGTPDPSDLSRLAALKVFHGSPHRFERFSSEKIGTGEGAQAYGHGLYFAERPGVARSYAEAAADYLEPTEEFYINSQKIDLEGLNWAQADAAELIAREGSFTEAKRRLHGVARNRYTQDQWMEVRQALEDYKGTMGHVVEIPQRPQFYEATLDVDPEDLLDWDAPLSEQPRRVRDALQNVRAGQLDLDRMNRSKLQYLASDVDPQGVWHDADFEAEFGYRQTTEELREAVKEMFRESPEYLSGRGVLDLGGESTGRSIMRQLEATLGSHEAAAEALRNAGIPGLRYFDQGSRGVGEGTRNIVMFPGSEDLIRIDKINEQPVRGALSDPDVRGPLD